MYGLNDSQHLKICCEIVLRSRYMYTCIYARTIASIRPDKALASSKF